MYRIISGKWKAKRIAAPKNFDVRPTTDFAKEALFSMLEHRYDMPYISVLDLFGGIGSICLEFASRDCKDITTVEMNPRHSHFIHITAQELDMDSQINIQRSDVFDWLKKKRNNGKSYELIFADPPFDMEEAKYEQLINYILEGDFLKDNATFVLEHESRHKIQHESLEETRKYGNVSFSFFKKNKAEGL